jgi:hypothetical protein
VPLLVVLILVAAAMLAPGLVVGPSLDASVFNDVGGRVLHGVTPYVGAWDHKSPGIYLVVAATQATLGWLGSWNAEWLLSLVVSVGIGISIAAALARLGVTGWSRSLAAIGSTIFASHYLLALGGGLTEPPAALLAGSALVLAIRPAGGGRLAVIGLLVGVSALISLQLLPGGLIVLALALSQRPAGARVKAAAPLSLGFAAPLAAVGIWLSAIGAMPAALDAIVTYSGAYRSSSNAYGSTLSTSVAAWTILMSIFLVAPALWGAVSPLSRLAARRPTVYAVLLWIAATLVFVVVQGRYYAHYAIALAVPIGILAGLGLHRVAESLQRARRPWLKVLIAFPLLLTLTVSVVAGVVSAALQLALVADSSVRMDAVSERLRDLPAGSLLVWGNEPRLYSLADRTPATRYAYLYPLTTPRYSSAAQIDEVLQVLENHPPAVVVDVGSPAPGQPGFLPLLIDRPIASEGRDLDLLDPLRAFVAAHYRLEAVVSGWPIYVLRDAQPGPDAVTALAMRRAVGTAPTNRNVTSYTNRRGSATITSTPAASHANRVQASRSVPTKPTPTTSTQSTGMAKREAACPASVA